MKILHIITNTDLGGAQSVCISLANEACKAGYTVALASMPDGYLWQALDKRVIQFRIKNMVKPIRPLADLRCLFELRNVIQKFNPDVIHLHSSKAGALGRCVRKKFRSRIIYTVHGFDSIRLRHRMFLPLERLLQKRCAFIVPVSDYDKQNLLAEKITHNVRTIHNGVAIPDIPHVCPFEKNGYKNVIMSIARMSKQKRFDMFLQTASQAPMRENLFVWIGGSAEKTLEDIKREYTIPANVLLLGNYPNASGLIAYCDLFVLFSNYEGLPMTVIEAMANGKAIVASAVGGMAELVNDTNGALIQTSDEATRALERILSDDARLQEMEAVSLKKYRDFFTVEKMWQKYKQLYTAVAK